MDTLLYAIKHALKKGLELPFSVYSSVHEQKLFNVPVVKPVLIVVLSGDKEIGNTEKAWCHTDNFIFLSDSPAINMRNIPSDREYFALLIEFDHDDFTDLPLSNTRSPEYFIGDTSNALKACLQQFIESAEWASPSIWSLRKKEILMLLHHMGYTQVASQMGAQKVSHQLHDMFMREGFQHTNTEFVCAQLAMSESTLRRKLQQEGTQLQEVKDRARFGLALHLLQTTSDAIGLVADRCGYQSQSRFTERFKNHFGLTPTELRKTKLAD